MSNLKLIITADDFCYNNERDKGIVDSLVKGALTRTSVMVNALNSTSTHMSQYLDVIKGSIGLHFNITEGYPLADPGLLSTLVDEKGAFFGKKDFLQKCRSKNINAEEVKRELVGQIEKFKEITGGSPLYIDGHQHVNVFPIVRDVMSEVMKGSVMAETRIPIEETEIPIETTALSQFLSDVSIEGREASKVYEAAGVKYSSKFLGLSLMGRAMTERKLKNLFKHLKQQAKNNPLTVELMCHPGLPCLQPAEGGCGHGADDFSQSPDRLHELEVLTAPSLLEFYRDEGIERVNSCAN